MGGTSPWPFLIWAMVEVHHGLYFYWFLLHFQTYRYPVGRPNRPSNMRIRGASPVGLDSI